MHYRVNVTHSLNVAVHCLSLQHILQHFLMRLLTFKIGSLTLIESYLINWPILGQLSIAGGSLNLYRANLNDSVRHLAN